MEGRVYGYARVSSQGQNLDRQVEALKERGIAERDIITDKKSGKDFSRQGYLSLKEHILHEGDTLVIKELDRLGRNYEQIRDEWKALNSLGVDIEVLDMPILNTANKQSIEKQLITNIVFELMSYIAESERHKIKQRQREGIEIARQKGVKFGRRPINKPYNWDEVYGEWYNGKITAVEAMRRTSLKRSTFYKLAEQERNNRS